LYSDSSCPAERGDRDRHDCGAGGGGRRRCGVTGCVGTGCLRAGRIVCGQDTTGTGGTACWRMERACGSSDGRPDSKRVRPDSLCSPGPVAQGPTRVTLIGHLGKHSASRQNTAGGTPGNRPCFPKVLMHTLAEDRIGIRPRGASGTRRSARPLARGREGMRKTRTRKRRETASACPIGNLQPSALTSDKQWSTA